MSIQCSFLTRYRVIDAINTIAKLRHLERLSAQKGLHLHLENVFFVLKMSSHYGPCTKAFLFTCTESHEASSGDLVNHSSGFISSYANSILWSAEKSSLIVEWKAIWLVELWEMLVLSKWTYGYVRNSFVCGLLVWFALLALCPSLCQGSAGPSPPLLFPFLLDASIQFGDASNPQYGVLDPLDNHYKKEHSSEDCFLKRFTKFR